MSQEPDGFFKALFEFSKNDPFMIWLLRLILFFVAVTLLISLPIYFIDKANNKHVRVLFGLLEYFPEEKRDFEKPNENQIGNDTMKVPKPKRENERKPSEISDEKGSRDVKKSTYEIKKPIFNGPVQIGDNNTQNNIGIQPRIITKESLSEFFSLNLETDRRIGFVSAIEEGEILNVKNQIIKILKESGYINIEEINGIRTMLGNGFPEGKISLINNAQGGITFFIGSSIK